MVNGKAEGKSLRVFVPLRRRPSRVFARCVELLGTQIWVTHTITKGTPEELQQALGRAREAYLYFRNVPAPRRGEIVRQIREAIATKVHVPRDRY